MYEEPKYVVSYKEYKRLDAALKLVLEKDPDFKIAGMPPTILYLKLEKLGLLDDFLKSYKAPKE